MSPFYSYFRNQVIVVKFRFYIAVIQIFKLDLDMLVQAEWTYIC
jgi:hypothetical protein